MRSTPYRLQCDVKGFPIHARRPTVGDLATRVGVGQNVFTPPTLSYKKWNRRVGSCLAFSVERYVGASESFLELPGSRQSPHLNSFRIAPRTRAAFLSPGITRVHLGSMSPSDACQRPPPRLEPLPGRPRQHEQVSRVASPRVRTCCAHYPGEQGDPVSCRFIWPPSWAFDLMRGDSALAFNLSRPAQASLALRPARLQTRPRRVSVPRAVDGLVALRHRLGSLPRSTDTSLDRTFTGCVHSPFTAHSQTC